MTQFPTSAPPGVPIPPARSNRSDRAHPNGREAFGSTRQVCLFAPLLVLVAAFSLVFCSSQPVSATSSRKPVIDAWVFLNDSASSADIKSFRDGLKRSKTVDAITALSRDSALTVYQAISPVADSTGLGGAITVRFRNGKSQAFINYVNQQSIVFQLSTRVEVERLQPGGGCRPAALNLEAFLEIGATPEVVTAAELAARSDVGVLQTEYVSPEQQAQVFQCAFADQPQLAAAPPSLPGSLRIRVASSDLEAVGRRIRALPGVTTIIEYVGFANGIPNIRTV
jgi:FtsX extracellular domain